jgi:transposase
VRRTVKEVAIDMSEKMRAVVEEVLKGAKVVVDPFHVIQDANHRLDEARRAEQQQGAGGSTCSATLSIARPMRTRREFTPRSSCSKELPMD